MEEKRGICEKYFDSIYRLILCRTKDRDIADDVTQDVFCKYIAADKEFESDEHAKAWLIRVAINCTNSYFTSSWFRKTVPLDENMVFETKERSDVYLAVSELPIKYRTVIHLFYYEDYSVSDISKALGLKETTVRTQLKRGRELLHDKLKGGCDIV